MREFLEFFFPGIAREIDWREPPEFLDKELGKLERRSRSKARRADSLVKVNRKADGEPIRVLVHIEVQSWYDRDFALRMFTSYYRLFDLSSQPLCQLAVFADKGKGWAPSGFTTELWGTRLTLEFPVAKLQEYNGDEQLNELARDINPFGLIVAATLQAQETRRDSRERLRVKNELTKWLLQSGQDEREIRRLYRFVDWLLEMTPALESLHRNDMADYEKENKMPPYITAIERHGIEQGIEQGIERVARRMRARGFTLQQIELATEASLEQLERWFSEEQSQEGP